MYHNLICIFKQLHCFPAESRAKKKKDWKADDYYGSDDDDYLDRTGDIERKRKMRMKMFGKKREKAETFESLVSSLAVNILGRISC